MSALTTTTVMFGDYCLGSKQRIWEHSRIKESLNYLSTVGTNTAATSKRVTSCLDYTIMRSGQCTLCSYLLRTRTCTPGGFTRDINRERVVLLGGGDEALLHWVTRVMKSAKMQVHAGHLSLLLPGRGAASRDRCFLIAPQDLPSDYVILFIFTMLFG
ncbi:hypothetical protein CBL_10341 [Carabus blaptoides fortunei]